MRLEEIAWPVYRLGERKPQREDGIIYYATEYTDLETAESTATLRVVDDANIPEPTLSRRRLKLLVAGEPLFPIRHAIYFLGDLLKVAKPTTWFIDSSGKLFQHKKTTRAKLIVRKIKNVFPTTGLGAVIELEGIPHRFKTAFKPPQDAEWAAVLKSGLTYIFYGVYSEKPKETWRLI